MATVSRVLNRSAKVSDETRVRVLEAIEGLGYRPNPLARGLSRGRTHTLGLLVPFFTHASAVERLRGVVAALDESSYDLVLFDVETPLRRDEHFTALARRGRVAGLLVMSLPPPPEELAALVAAGVPVVLVDAVDHDVPAVVIDNVEGGRVATRHLLGLGHRRIAFIGESPDNPFGFTSSAQREQGCADALAQAGLALDRTMVAYCPHDRSAAQRVALELLGRPDRPTAVFASSDVQALGVLAAAADRGLRVPHDVSVVGFDDVEVSSYAELTTVRQPLYESGRLGAELLLAALNGAHADDLPSSPGDERLFPTPGATPDARTRLVHELPVELVVRKTTAPPSMSP